MPRDVHRAVSVFISYRREGGFYLAKSIFDDLEQRGHDVFMDVHTLGAGEFERTTLAEIRVRDFFVIVLTKGSLDRMSQGHDWLRRELSTALRAERTVIPVLDLDFRFEDAQVQTQLERIPETLRRISGFNAVRMPQPEYFASGLERLRTFLAKPVEAPRTRARAPAEHVEKAKATARTLVAPPARDVTPSTGPARSWSDLQNELQDAGRITLQRLDVALPAPTLRRGVLGGLTWTTVKGATGYLLERDTHPGFESPAVLYEGRYTTHTDITYLYRTEPLFYRVKAKGRLPLSRDSDWSPTAALQPLKATPAPPVGTPKLSPGFLGDLRWTSVKGAAGYLLQRDTDSGFGSPTVLYEGQDTSYTDTAFLFGAKPVHYRVKAMGNPPLSRDSDWSPSAALQRPKGKPARPLDTPKLNFGLLGGLTWSSVKGAAGYLLQRDTDPGFGSPTVLYEGQDTRHTDIAFLLGTQPFFYRVRAKGNVMLSTRDSDWSPPATLEPRTTEPARRLDAPTLDCGVFGGLTWTSVKGATGYLLQRDTDPAFGSPTVLFEGKATTYSDSVSVFGAAPVFYRVKARGTPPRNRDSDWSRAATLQPLKP